MESGSGRFGARRRLQVAGRGERRDLMDLRASGRTAATVELAGVEAERSAGGGIVAGEAFAATGVAPCLGPIDATVADPQGLGEPLVGHEFGAGGRSPPVGDAIHPLGHLDEEPRLDPATGLGRSAFHLHLEMLHPDGAGRGLPCLHRIGPHPLAGRDVHPPPLHRMVGPEGQVHLVVEECLRGRQCREVLEGARGLEGDGKGPICGIGRGHQPHHLARIELDGQKVSVGGIHAEARHIGDASEPLDRPGAGRIPSERPDVAVHIVGEDVGPVQRGDPAAPVHPPAGDRIAPVVAAAVGVHMHRRHVPERGLGQESDRCSGARPGHPTLAEGPPVIGSGAAHEHHLPAVLPHIADPKVASGRVEGEAPRVAEPDRVEFGADIRGIDRCPVEGGRTDEGIVGRDGVVGGDHPPVGGVPIRRQRPGPLIDVDPEESGEEVPVDPLPIGVRVIAAALVAEGHVQEAVGPEVQVAPVVVRGFVALSEEPDLGGRVEGVGVVGRGPELRQHVVGLTGGPGPGVQRAEHEQAAVLRIPGMERQPEQPLLAGGEQVVGQGGEDGSGGLAQVGDHHDPAGLLDDEQPLRLARRCRGGHRLIEPHPGEGVDERVGRPRWSLRQTAEGLEGRGRPGTPHLHAGRQRKDPATKNHGHGSGEGSTNSDRL